MPRFQSPSQFQNSFSKPGLKMVMCSQLLHDHGFGTEIESEVQKAP